MSKKWTDKLPDLFGRRRIYKLECELEEAQGHIEELEAEAGVVSADFEKDCWRSLRRILDRCQFDWRHVDSDGVTADEAEEFIREAIDDLEARLTRALNPDRPTVEEFASYLCDHFDADFNPCHGHYWPEHKDDDGYRGSGGYVKLQPIDVQEHARENAQRIMTFLRIASPPPMKRMEGSE